MIWVTLNNYKKRAMKKLLVVLATGLLFASCESQPNFEEKEIPAAAINALKSGQADTVLMVKTNQHNYQTYQYSLFKANKQQTYIGTTHRYNDNETGFVIMGCIGIVFGIFLGAILFNN